MTMYVDAWMLWFLLYSVRLHFLWASFVRSTASTWAAPQALYTLANLLPQTSHPLPQVAPQASPTMVLKCSLDSCQLGFYDIFKDGIGTGMISQLFAEAEAGADSQLNCVCQAVRSWPPRTDSLTLMV